LLGLARAYRAIGLAAEDTPAGRIADAYRMHPEWTSGTKRYETRLMHAVPGLVNKAGAEGVDAMSLPDGRTVAIKIADGNQRARVPVAVAALRRLGVDEPGLDELASAPVLGGSEQVGEIRAVI
jgi:L-asparaginase II